MQTQFEVLAEQDLKLDEVLAAEVERRIADIDNGVSRVIPMDEALALVRETLRRQHN